MDERTNRPAARCAAVLPSLDPTEKLDAVVAGLVAAGFRDVILVDDGSDAAHQGPFARAAARPEVTLLRHPANRGKGAALKTAFRYLLDERPEITGAVTVDGDGQHRPADVRRCAGALEEGPEALVLGVRDFSLPGVPARSRMGNRITSFVFRTGCGIRLSDTQTGLRAMGAALFPALLAISGERFEYETNMLLELHRRGLPFREVPIETVYEDGNSGSHFRAVHDSLRIYGLILKYMASSFASAGVDLLAFWGLHALLAAPLGQWAVAASTALARLCSSFVNFNLNRRLVFGSRRGYGSAMGRYYVLCLLQFAASAGLVTLLERLAGTASSGLLTLMKAAVDTALFFLSFRIQRRWVFAED